MRYLAVERGLSENYQLSTRRSLAEFAEWSRRRHNLKSPREITIDHITEYLADRKRAGLAAASIKLIVVAVKIFFRFLIYLLTVNINIGGKNFIVELSHLFFQRF